MVKLKMKSVIELEVEDRINKNDYKLTILFIN